MGSLSYSLFIRLIGLNGLAVELIGVRDNQRVRWIELLGFARIFWRYREESSIGGFSVHSMISSDSRSTQPTNMTCRDSEIAPTKQPANFSPASAPCRAMGMKFLTYSVHRSHEIRLRERYDSIFDWHGCCVS